MPKAGSKRCSGCWKTGASDSPQLGALGCGEMGISGKIVHISLDFDTTRGGFLHLLSGKKP